MENRTNDETAVKQPEINLSFLLYIGEDQEVIDLFNDQTDFKLINKSNGILAKNWLKANKPPFAILSEAILPGITGFALFFELQDDTDCQNIPFVLLDKTFTKEEKKRAIEVNIDDIYYKPINYQKLKLRLEFLNTFKKQKTLVSALNKKHFIIKTPLWKRVFDILFVIVLLIILSPVFFIVILAIIIESRGPIFYSGKRVGAGYTIFPFHKFRSMYVGADAKIKELAESLNQYNEKGKTIQNEPLLDCPRCKELGKPCSPVLKDAKGRDVCEYQYILWKKSKEGSTFIKLRNDPRITKVGKIIRRTSIDELPQLFNVLQGHMSVVGNRPIPLYEAEKLTSDDWAERFKAPAGITGLWQVVRRGKPKNDNNGEMSENERKGLDIEYARNFNFWTDLKIILLTPFALINRDDM